MRNPTTASEYKTGVGGAQHRELWTSLFVLFALGVFVAVNWANGRLEMADFRVYFDAAGRWISGDSPYGRAYGLSSGFFKYAPLVLLPFAGLNALGWSLGSSLYLGVLLSSMVWFVPKLLTHSKAALRSKEVHLSRTRVGTYLLFAALCLQHLSRELLLGNVNWFLLLGVGWWWLEVRKPKRDAMHAFKTGFLLAIICLFKPHFAILWPWLIWRRPQRYAVWAAVWVVFLLLLPSLWLGVRLNFEMLLDWAGALVGHNAAKVTSFNTFAGMLGLANSSAFAFVPPVLALAGLIIWIGRTKVPPLHDQAMEVMLLVGLLPNLVLTDTEHFMWSFPLLAWIVILLRSRSFWEGTPTWDKHLTWAFFALLWLPYSLASPDIWGAAAGAWLEHSGVLGWSNALMVISAAWLHHVHLTPQN